MAYKRIVVGFSTLPRRIPGLGPVLDSINAQSIRADAIYISVPRFSTRENRPYPMEELQNIAQKYGAEIVIVDEDYGPLTKLMGMLLKEPHKIDTLLITVDDDHALHPRTIESLVRGAYKYPMDVVAINGVRVDTLSRPLLPQFYSAVWLKNAPMLSSLALKDGDQVNIIMGYGGVAYPRWVFGTEIPNVAMETRRKDTTANTYIPKLHNHDDLYTSAWLKILGVRKRCVDFIDPCSGHQPLPQSREYALCADGNVSRTNSTAIKHVRGWFAIINALQKQQVLERNCEMSDVPIYKDTVLISAITITATLVLLAGICVYTIRKCKKSK